MVPNCLFYTTNLLPVFQWVGWQFPHQESLQTKVEPAYIKHHYDISFNYSDPIFRHAIFRNDIPEYGRRLFYFCRTHNSLNLEYIIPLRGTGGFFHPSFGIFSSYSFMTTFKYVSGSTLTVADTAIIRHALHTSVV